MQTEKLSNIVPHETVHVRWVKNGIVIHRDIHSFGQLTVKDCAEVIGCPVQSVLSVNVKVSNRN